MTFVTENIIPGNHGKKFATDVNDPTQKSRLKNELLKVPGVMDVIFDVDKDPLVFTIHTNKVVKVSAIQEKAKELNFHVIAKGPYYPLM